MQGEGVRCPACGGKLLTAVAEREHGVFVTHTCNCRPQEHETVKEFAERIGADIVLAPTGELQKA